MTPSPTAAAQASTAQPAPVPRWHELADRVLAGNQISASDALAVLRAPDAQLMEVVAAASRLRFHHFGNKLKVNYLVNLKSGLCPEDCFYCSQRLNSTAGILRYTWLNTEEAVTAAKAGIAAGASRVCLVASGTGPSNREVGKVSDIIEAIKTHAKTNDLEKVTLAQGVTIIAELEGKFGATDE